MPLRDADRAHFQSLLARCSAMGSVPVALVGAGRICKELRPTLAAHPGVILGVIDDDAAKQGRVWAGLEVLSAGQAVERGVKAVIITAEGSAQDALFATRQRFLRAGLQVFTCPSRFESFPWDDALLDHYECHLARSRGIGAIYSHIWPEEGFTPHEPYVAMARQALGGASRPAICEIGAGSGLYTQPLIEGASVYYCVDASGRGLHEALEHRLHKHIDTLRCIVDATATLAGVPDASIDLVHSFGTFDHIKIDVTHQFFAAFRRVLKPAGKAVLQFRAWNDAAIESLPVFGKRPGEHNVMQYTHPDQLRLSAERQGLKIEIDPVKTCAVYMVRVSRCG